MVSGWFILLVAFGGIGVILYILGIIMVFYWGWDELDDAYATRSGGPLLGWAYDWGMLSAVSAKHRRDRKLVQRRDPDTLLKQRVSQKRDKLANKGNRKENDY